MEYERLDKKAILSWRIGRGIVYFIQLIIFIIGLIIINQFEELERFTKYAYIALGFVLAYSIFGFIVYPLIEYRQWRYAITEDKVEIRHGIFFINTTVIPIVRIQHISVLQGPIERKLGLHKIKVALASGTFEIVGLSKDKSDYITENLKNKLYTRLQAKGV